MENYVFRTIRFEEEYSPILFNKKVFEESPLVDLYKLDCQLGDDALDAVSKHVGYGNRQKTHWISCTKNMNVVLRYMHYGYISPSIAVIKNHSHDCLECKPFNNLLNQLCDGTLDTYKFIEQARRIPFYQINKMVLDVSTGKSDLFNNLIKLKLVYNANGNLVYKPWSKQVGFSESCQEVLVLGEIPRSDFKILNPLQFDMLYILTNGGDTTLIDEHLFEDIFLYVDDYFSMNLNLWCESDYNLYDEMSSVLYEAYSRLNEYDKKIFDMFYISRYNFEDLYEMFSLSPSDAISLRLKLAYKINKSCLEIIYNSKMEQIKKLVYA